MPWTIVDEEHDFIHIRAIIDAKHDPKELIELIDALVRRQRLSPEPKEITSERPDA